MTVPSVMNLRIWSSTRRSPCAGTSELPREINSVCREVERGSASDRYPVKQQTRLRVLAADFARALLRRFAHLSQEGAGKAGCRLAPTVCCAKWSAKRPHSSIQV